MLPKNPRIEIINKVDTPYQASMHGAAGEILGDLQDYLTSGHRFIGAVKSSHFDKFLGNKDFSLGHSVETGLPVLTKFSNKGKSFEAIEFSKNEETDQVDIKWSASPDVEKKHGADLSDTRWAVESDMIAYVSDGKTTFARSDSLSNLLATAHLPGGLRKTIESKAKLTTEARAKSILYEFQHPEHKKNLANFGGKTLFARSARVLK